MLLAFILCLKVPAQQNADRDSLLQVYNTQFINMSDSNKMELLIGIGEAFKYDQPDSSLAFYKQALGTGILNHRRASYPTHRG